MRKTNEKPDDRTPEEERQLFDRRWLRFESEFPKGCNGLEKLCDLLYNSPSRKCSKCHTNNVVRIEGTRYVRCLECGAKTSLTAGTFFHNARSPKAWLGAIRMTELGVKFSARALSVVAKISYDTAWHILKKIDSVLRKNLESDTATLPSKIFEKMFIKRSRETPAREHPRYEQLIAEREMSKVPSQDLESCSANERMILSVMGNQIVNTDVLCEQTKLSPAAVAASLMMLELSGLIEVVGGDSHRRKFGGGGIAKAGEHSEGLVKRFIKDLRQCKRGIARKYLHFYLARFWCVEDRKRWKKGRLLKECLLAHDYPREVLRLQVAPLMVQVPGLVA